MFETSMWHCYFNVALLLQCGIVTSMWHCCFNVALLLQCGIVTSMWHCYFNVAISFNFINKNNELIAKTIILFTKKLLTLFKTPLSPTHRQSRLSGGSSGSWETPFSSGSMGSCCSLGSPLPSISLLAAQTWSSNGSRWSSRSLAWWCGVVVVLMVVGHGGGGDVVVVCMVVVLFFWWL